MTLPPASPAIGILLAAGSGSRFRAAWAEPAAPAPHKLLATLPDGRPVALASAQALRAALPVVVAAVAPGRPALAQLLADAGCEVLVCPDAEDGMGASLAAAARHIAQHADPHCHACVVALADMPWVRPDTHQRIALADTHAPIVAGAYQGRRGHPVRFARALWPALGQLQADVGARALMAEHDVALLDGDDAGVLRDVDLPTDLGLEGGVR